MSVARSKTGAVGTHQQVGRSLRALGSDLDRLDEAVAARFDLHRTDLRCVEIVGRAGPVSAGRLAELAGLSTSAVTSVIDRMQRAGYLRRSADPSDRRRVLVELTARGRRDGRAAFAGLMAGTERLLASYRPEELELIGRFVEQVRALVRDEAAKAAGPNPAATTTASRGERARGPA